MGGRFPWKVDDAVDCGDRLLGLGAGGWMVLERQDCRGLERKGGDLDHY
jgi:hypothetical protein